MPLLFKWDLGPQQLFTIGSRYGTTVTEEYIEALGFGQQGGTYAALTSSQYDNHLTHLPNGF